PRRVADPRAPTGRHQPARGLRELVRPERAPGRGERRRRVEARAAPPLPHARWPPGWSRRHPGEIREREPGAAPALQPAHRSRRNQGRGGRPSRGGRAPGGVRRKMPR
ncbi:MAG: hypothetical protein ACK55Z_05895, partial [bacterium]